MPFLSRNIGIVFALLTLIVGPLFAERRFLVPRLEPGTVLGLSSTSVESVSASINLYSARGGQLVYTQVVTIAPLANQSSIALDDYLNSYPNALGGWAEITSDSDMVLATQLSRARSESDGERLAEPGTAFVAVAPVAQSFATEAEQIDIINTSPRVARVDLQGISEDGHVVWKLDESVGPFARASIKTPSGPAQTSNSAIRSVRAHSSEPIWMSGVLCNGRSTASLDASEPLPASLLEAILPALPEGAAVRIRIVNFSSVIQEARLAMTTDGGDPRGAFSISEVVTVLPHMSVDKIIDFDQETHGSRIQVVAAHENEALLPTGAVGITLNYGIEGKSVGFRRLGETDLAVIVKHDQSSKTSKTGLDLKAAKILDALFAQPVLTPATPKVDLTTCTVSFSATFQNPLTPVPPLTTTNSLLDVYLQEIKAMSRNVAGAAFNPGINEGPILPGEKFRFGVTITGTRNSGKCNTPIRFYVNVMGDRL